MIIEVRPPVEPDPMWCAVFLCHEGPRLVPDSSGIAGWGKNASEAIGSLMRKWSVAEDADQATDKLDFRIIWK